MLCTMEICRQLSRAINRLGFKPRLNFFGICVELAINSEPTKSATLLPQAALFW
jgi:hypothetical protein